MQFGVWLDAFRDACSSSHLLVIPSPSFHVRAIVVCAGSRQVHGFQNDFVSDCMGYYLSSLQELDYITKE